MNFFCVLHESLSLMSEQDSEVCDHSGSIHEVLIIEDNLTDSLASESDDDGEEDDNEYSSLFRPSTTIEEIEAEQMEEQNRRKEERAVKTTTRIGQDGDGNGPRKRPVQSQSACCLLM